MFIVAAAATNATQELTAMWECARPTDSAMVPARIPEYAAKCGTVLSRLGRELPSAASARVTPPRRNNPMKYFMDIALPEQTTGKPAAARASVKEAFKTVAATIKQHVVKVATPRVTASGSA